jgi:hypothetical protein
MIPEIRRATGILRPYTPVGSIDILRMGDIWGAITSEPLKRRWFREDWEEGRGLDEHPRAGCVRGEALRR